MRTIPKDDSLDGSLALLREGYLFITNRCRRLGSDVFETRLLFERAICMQGQDAARLFYDNTKFKRGGAAPRRLTKTLFGEGGVQGLDGAAHRQRKELFLSLLKEAEVQRLVRLVDAHWHAFATRWQHHRCIVFFDEMRQLLFHAGCEWLGIPLPFYDADQRVRDIGAMIDGAGGVGTRYLTARIGRLRSERWIADLIGRARAHRPEDVASALIDVAHYRDVGGELLDRHAAAVEILNLLRPTVAVARFATFAALALHEHPEARERVAVDPVYRSWFVTEVRRFYPFFPFVAARVRSSFKWNGFTFPEGGRVILDLYGTNHDPRLWHDPERFEPERFRDHEPRAYALVPQGAGDHKEGHRCPGERLASDVTTAITQLLVLTIDYRVPQQDLSISLARLPALPKSRLRFDQVRTRAGMHARGVP